MNYRREYDDSSGLGWKYGIGDMQKAFLTGYVVGLGPYNAISHKDNSELSHSRETIKHEVKAFFEQHHGQPVDYIDLVDNLDYSLPDIVEACAELEMEGKIVGIDQEAGEANLY